MNTFTTLQSLLGAMLVGVTLFTCAQLLLERKFRQDQLGFLISILLLHALYTCGELFILTGAILAFPHLAGLQLPLNTLLGPAIYFYARSMMSSNTMWVYRKDAWALLGPVVVAIALVPIARLDEATKLALANPSTRDPALFAQALFICSFAFIVFLLFLYTYLYLALRRRARYRSNLQNHFANLDGRSLDWLQLTLIILAVGWAWTSLSSIWQLLGTRPEWVGVLTALVQFGFVSAFALGAITQPPMELPNSMADDEPSYSENNESDSAAENTSYRGSALTPDRMARIALKLQKSMEQDRLFERSGLSLRQLSDHIGVSENYISETFSRHLSTNFFEFVNKCRIDEACILLLDSEETVLDIAYRTGFNSRSTFNAAFKKYTGKTPRQFRVRAGKNT